MLYAWWGGGVTQEFTREGLQVVSQGLPVGAARTVSLGTVALGVVAGGGAASAGRKWTKALSRAGPKYGVAAGALQVGGGCPRPGPRGRCSRCGSRE